MSKKGRISKMCEESELRRGPWTLEEDNLLIHYITCHGEGRWNALANFAGLKRTGKSCRLRWLNYLNPSIKRGNLTTQEQLLILELHSKWGNRWSKIALHLPGRTDNEIKNYWRTRVQKQARQLKVDSNSNKFLEAIRSIWMPTLMDPSSSSIETSNSNTAPVFNHPHHLTLNSNFPDSNLQPPENLTPSKINPQVDYHDIQEMESHHIALSGCHVAGSDCFGDDLGSATFWNTDELWQLGWSWPVDTQT